MNKNTIKFEKITVCLDMAGCPNRCKHCWLGVSKNGNFTNSDLEYVADTFKPYADKFEIASWYREPDYKNNYKELWALENQLSTEKTPHFELMSFWRIVRDGEYVKWLYSLGVRVCQLTLFGMEETTDYYIGRKGAFQEILKATDMLLLNGIAPRFQIFVTKNNISELALLESLIIKMNLERRSAEIGQRFQLFVWQGDCSGANEQFYDVRLTPEDILKIPNEFAEYTIMHFGKSSIDEVLGSTECKLYEELVTEKTTQSIISSKPVFNVDKDFNVFPNLTYPSPWLNLGNLKADGVDIVISNYLNFKSTAQDVMIRIRICDMVKQCGNPSSQRLFQKDDYITYIMNQYCKRL